MADSNTILYSFWRSSCTWRVRMVLNFKGIPYQIHPIDLRKSSEQQFSDEFLKINPLAQVPALTIDGHTLFESMAIIQYLDDTRPEVPIFPKDPFSRAKVRQICEIITSGIQPLQNDVVLNRVGDEKEKEWAQFFIKRGFKAIEKLLQFSARKYCVGSEVTLADICLIPMVHNARLFDVDLREFPTIERIEQSLKDYPPFVSAHPMKQIDAD